MKGQWLENGGWTGGAEFAKARDGTSADTQGMAASMLTAFSRRGLRLGLSFCLTCALAVPAFGQEDVDDVRAPPDAAAALEEGRRLYFEGDYEAAKSVWEPLAEAGDARALYNMATLYRRGLGVDRDQERAWDLLRQSAEKGFAEAQYLLADLTMRDREAEEGERQQAVRWWLAAAGQDHALSQYRLGLLYWNGEAVARDLVRGHAWMRLAAGSELEDARKALETMQQYLSPEQQEESAALAETLTEEPPTDLAPPPVPVSASETEQAETERAEVAQKHGEAGDTEAEPASSGETVTPARDRPFAQGWRLQLAALKDRETAEGLWRRLSGEASDLVSDIEHRIERADLGDRGTFYRLQIGPFASREAAAQRCQALEAAGYGCFPVSPDS